MRMKVMANAVDLIRLEIGERDPQSLFRLMWPGAAPNREDFLAYGRTALSGFWKCEGRSIQPNPGYGLLTGKPIPEAVRLLDDEDKELYRYDIYDLWREIRYDSD
jgi:hypothetical protein